MSSKKLNVAGGRELLGVVLQKLQRYSLLVFLVFIAVLYGILIMQINSLSNTQPSSLDVNNQIKAAQLPHIDQSVVKQLQSLQDNSVNVQTLFNEARSNPFQ